jgi:hypothetical protein
MLVEDMSRNICFLQFRISHALRFISICDLFTDSLVSFSYSFELYTRNLVWYSVPALRIAPDIVLVVHTWFPHFKALRRTFALDYKFCSKFTIKLIHTGEVGLRNSVSICKLNWRRRISLYYFPPVIPSEIMREFLKGHLIWFGKIVYRFFFIYQKIIKFQ